MTGGLVEELSRPLSRRRLLQLTAGGIGAAALAPLLTPRAHAGLRAAMATEADTLKMWWWGQQEAVGIQKWVDDTLKKFTAKTGVNVKPTLMGTDNVIPQFTSAAAAGKPPDVQFLFNGIYHMENVWLGYVNPLNGLVSPNVLKNSGATKLSTYKGKQYRVGFYSVGFGLAYNKDHFRKAGLDPQKPPKTWAQFTAACEALKAEGYIPIGGGVKDGFLGEWYLVNSLTQNLNSPAEALQLFIGNRDWRNPRYYEHWSKLEELHKKGYINKDANSLQLYQGIQLFDTGKASMCFNTTPAIPNSQKQLGTAKVGFMVMPRFGKGAMAGIPITDTQGFGIPTKGSDHDNAAKLLEFMHSKERVQAIWTLSKQIPANTTFDASVIKDPLLRTIQQKWVAGKHNAYIADLMPTKFWTDAMFVASQKILSGSMTGKEAGQLAYNVTKTWKKQNPDMVANYKAWSADLA
jgi:raffinose/stachyose/melibiose transport system substrate-binding protein